MAQALVRYLMAQRALVNGLEQPLIAGVFAIYGHGNVAGLGEALFAAREALPTYRPHNEQAMAHAAIAYAKASKRRRMMACTTSIGPGATNMITAAAVAHVNRLPVLFLPGDIFANRRPDPVLQQVEDFADRSRAEAVEGLEQRPHRFLVRLLPGGEAGLVDAVVDALVNDRVNGVDLGAQRPRVEIHLGPAVGIEGGIEHADDLGRFVVDDAPGPLVPQHRHRGPAGVVGLGLEVDLA